MQFDKSILAYEIDLKAENKSPATIRRYIHKLSSHAGPSRPPMDSLPWGQRIDV